MKGRLILYLCICLNGTFLVAAGQTGATATDITSTAPTKQGKIPGGQEIEKARKILSQIDQIPDPVEKKKQLEEAYRMVQDSPDDSLVNVILFQLAFNANITGDWARGFEWAMTGMNRIGADSHSPAFPAFANMIAQSLEKQRDYPAALIWA